MEEDNLIDESSIQPIKPITLKKDDITSIVINAIAKLDIEELERANDTIVLLGTVAEKLGYIDEN